MVTPEPCPTCGQSDATPRRTVPSSAGYRCPDCKRFKIRDTTPEPCVVCGGRGETLTEDCYGAECMVTCRVCMGSRVRPSPWAWTASLGAENSSEVGMGVKDATGGRRRVVPSEKAMVSAETRVLTAAAVLAERERVLALIEAYIQNEAPIFTDSGVGLDFDIFIGRIRGGMT